MRKQFCQRCHCRTKCKRVCKIVYAELTSKGVLQTLHEYDRNQYPEETGALHSMRSVRVEFESDLEGPQEAQWMNRIYGAYSDPKE